MGKETNNLATDFAVHSAMNQADSTCWTIIEAAAAGGSEACEYFARRYGPTIRAYLSARWKSTVYLSDVDDTIQEVFIECFKQGGLLSKADRERGNAFRTFLYAATRNVALRVESKRAARREHQPNSEFDPDRIEADEAALSDVFDKAWAKAILHEAGERQRKRAEEKGEKALRRVDLLKLRFEKNLPIREIAEQWQCDAAVLHHEYARARQEFKEALFEVVAFHHPGTADEINQECVGLLKSLG